MSPADRVAKPEDFVVPKLDHPVARSAMQVVVGRVPVVVLEGTPVRQPKLAQQARLDQQAKCSIDRRPADLLAGVVQVADQLVGVEVLV